MIKKLLFLIGVLSISMNSYAQATAFPVPNLQQCNFEVFDLTVQTPIVLGNQNPADFSVGYFMSQSDANDNVNEIMDPTFFVGGMVNTIFIRVTNMQDDTFAITLFTASWDFSPQVPQMPDVTACDSYLLPALPQDVSYWSAPNGGGTQIFPGMMITATMTIYIWGGNDICQDESEFLVTIVSTPGIDAEDVTACESYVLPSLPSGFDYYSGPGGTGVLISAGDMITQTTMLYILGQSGTTPNCTSETSFNVIIGGATLNLAPVVGCETDGDGFGQFDLDTVANGIMFGIPGSEVSFHESEADAETGINMISSPYFNIAPFNQTIFVRVEMEGGSCMSVSPVVLSVEECTGNTISGLVQFDLTQDGCTSSDDPLTNVQVSCTNGNVVTYAYVNDLGYYTFTNVQEGTNHISIQGLPTGSVVTPNQIVVAGVNNSYTADFCVTGPVPVNDATVFIQGNIPVPGFPSTYYMHVLNYGTTVLSGSATLTFDDSMLTFIGVIPNAASQTTNTVTFSYSNLLPYQSQVFQVNFTVKPPPTVNAGDILIASAVVNTNQPDAHPSNNSAVITQTVVNSYDPNDITVHEGPFITEAQADGYLHYTVRFQNMGTAPAVNVRIENELDTHLDWSTFTPLASSHSYNAERTNGDLTFRFNNIMLPAEQDNEPASHGWIMYKVKPVAGFAIGDVISNTASIFFDFNSAIVTNTVTTEIQQLSVSENGLTVLKMYPNPTSGVVYIAGVAGSFEVGLFDIQGKTIKTTTLTDNQPLDVSDVDAGIYFVRVSSNDASVTKKLIVR